MNEEMNINAIEANEIQYLRPDPRDYAESQKFLLDFWIWKKTKIPNYSLRLWAQKMGFKNHSLLSLLLSGRRGIAPNHLSNLIKGLQLPDQEQKYFELLVHLQNANSETERELYEQKLKLLTPHGKKMIHRDVEAFRFISNWVHTAILEMTMLKDFKPDAAWIASELEEKVSVSEITAALTRLKDLGLLVEQKSTLKKKEALLTFGGDKASQAVREYHKQVMQLAYKAVENQKRDDRILNSFTFTIDSGKLQKAEKLISEFRANLEDLLESPKGDATYQCNIQLFRLTKKRRDI